MTVPRPLRWLRAAAITAVALLTLYVAACSLARLAVFPAPKTFQTGKPASGELLEVKTPDGFVAHAYYWPAAPGKRTVAHFHGNAAVIHEGDERAGALRSRGLGVVLIEYRGYGISGGTSPSEEGLYTDAAAVLDALAARGVGPATMVLYGTSIGTGVASEMAKRGKGSALVLVTPFTSLPAVGARFAPFLPISLIVRDKFDTLSKASAIHLPTLVVHGTADEVVPYDMGVTVAKALNGTLITVPGGGHNDLFDIDASLLGRICDFAAK